MGYRDTAHDGEKPGASAAVSPGALDEVIPKQVRVQNQLSPYAGTGKQKGQLLQNPTGKAAHRSYLSVEPQQSIRD